MTKIIIDKSMDDLSDEEIEEIKASAKTPPADMKFPYPKEVRLSPQVAAQLEKMGMTPDDLVAMLMKKMGNSQ